MKVQLSWDGTSCQPPRNCCIDTHQSRCKDKLNWNLTDSLQDSDCHYSVKIVSSRWWWNLCESSCRFGRVYHRLFLTWKSPSLPHPISLVGWATHLGEYSHVSSFYINRYKSSKRKEGKASWRFGIFRFLFSHRSQYETRHGANAEEDLSICQIQSSLARKRG